MTMASNPSGSDQQALPQMGQGAQGPPMGPENPANSVRMDSTGTEPNQAPMPSQNQGQMNVISPASQQDQQFNQPPQGPYYHPHGVSPASQMSNNSNETQLLMQRMDQLQRSIPELVRQGQQQFMPNYQGVPVGHVSPPYHYNVPPQFPMQAPPPYNGYHPQYGQQQYQAPAFHQQQFSPPPYYGQPMMTPERQRAQVSYTSDQGNFMSNHSQASTTSSRHSVISTHEDPVDAPASAPESEFHGSEEENHDLSDENGEEDMASLASKKASSLSDDNGAEDTALLTSKKDSSPPKEEVTEVDEARRAKQRELVQQQHNKQQRDQEQARQQWEQNKQQREQALAAKQREQEHEEELRQAKEREEHLRQQIRQLEAKNRKHTAQKGGPGLSSLDRKEGAPAAYPPPQVAVPENE